MIGINRYTDACVYGSILHERDLHTTNQAASTDPFRAPPAPLVPLGATGHYGAAAKARERRERWDCTCTCVCARMCMSIVNLKQPAPNTHTHNQATVAAAAAATAPTHDDDDDAADGSSPFTDAFFNNVPAERVPRSQGPFVGFGCWVAVVLVFSYAGGGYVCIRTRAADWLIPLYTDMYTIRGVRGPGRHPALPPEPPLL